MTLLLVHTRWLGLTLSAVEHSSEHAVYETCCGLICCGQPTSRHVHNWFAVALKQRKYERSGVISSSEAYVSFYAENEGMGSGVQMADRERWHLLQSVVQTMLRTCVETLRSMPIDNLQQICTCS